MQRFASTLVTRYSPIRRAIYRLLLSAPRASWAVAEVASALPPGTGSAETVRATLYVLTDAGILQAANDGVRLRFQLSDSGPVHLRSIVAAWPA
jgi:hypothetical protein